MSASCPMSEYSVESANKKIQVKVKVVVKVEYPSSEVLKPEKTVKLALLGSYWIELICWVIAKYEFRCIRDLLLEDSNE